MFKPSELTYDVFYDILTCEDVTETKTVLFFLILLAFVSCFIFSHQSHYRDTPSRLLEPSPRAKQKIWTTRQSRYSRQSFLFHSLKLFTTSSSCAACYVVTAPATRSFSYNGTFLCCWSLLKQLQGLQSAFFSS